MSKLCIISNLWNWTWNCNSKSGSDMKFSLAQSFLTWFWAFEVNITHMHFFLQKEWKRQEQDDHNSERLEYTSSCFPFSILSFSLPPKWSLFFSSTCCDRMECKEMKQGKATLWRKADETNNDSSYSQVLCRLVSIFPPSSEKVILSFLVWITLATRRSVWKGLHVCNSPTCTLSQNGYGHKWKEYWSIS